jgi:hypothetical protein
VFEREKLPSIIRLVQRWEMNILSEQAKVDAEGRLSHSSAPSSADLPGRVPGTAYGLRARAVDMRTQQMRRLGLALCAASAMVTLASATLLAIKL